MDKLYTKAKLMIDKWFKQENLADLHDYFAESFGMIPKATGRVRKSVKRKNPDYRDYYSSKMVEAVKDKNEF